ncbi:MAG: protein kinase domain-containing protein [Gemmatimonadales bacterium]
MTDLDRLSTAFADRYRLERELGQGGMATVYLAQDLKHDRQVAIKVLRPELAAVLGRERFLAEIRLTAKLDHPHILALIDSGEVRAEHADPEPHSGETPRAVLYYVLPYIRGESLRQRLDTEKQLAIDEAVRIARQVASALDYAHRQGVIHRDIKPENILLHEGEAMLADFGIALAVREAGGERLTGTGLSVGTPQYMSPEQATGERDLTGRSDLFSLGAVVYEMLTGEPPFRGRTPQAVVARLMTERPAAIRTVRDSVPPGLEAAVLKALAKVPADRFPSGGEFAAALSEGMMPTGASPIAAVPGRRRRALAVLGSAAVVFAIGVIARQVLTRETMRITTSDIRHVTSEPGVEFQPALSPDGKEVAFVAGPIGNARLVIRSTINLTGGEFRLADTALGSQWLPSWSPDGEFVRFWACPGATDHEDDDPDCVWKETGRLGGAVRSVVLPRNTSRASWSPDGARVAFAVCDSLFGYSVADGKTTLVAVQGVAQRDLHSLAWSPDGRLLAYVVGNWRWRWGGNVDHAAIWIVAAAGGEPVRVTSAEFLNVSPAWLDSRHLLFVSNRDGPRGIYMVEVGPQGPRGEPRSVSGASDPHSISYSVTGRRLAYANLSLRQNIWSYPVGRSGPISIRDGRRVTNGNQVIEAHDVSPDGKWLAYDNNLGGDMNLYKMPLGGGDPVQLTHGPGNEFAPTWSPDGTEIAFYAGIGTTNVFVIPAEGGTPVRLPSSPSGAANPRWSPSGLQIVFWGGRGFEWWLVSRDRVGGPWHEAVPLADSACALTGRRTAAVLLCPRGSTVTQVTPQGRVLSRSDVPVMNHLRLSPFGTSAPDGLTWYASGIHEDGRRGIWAIPTARGEPRLVIADDDPALVDFGGVSVGPGRLYLTVSEYESDIWVAKLATQ